MRGETMGMLLRRLRLAAGLSQTDLAKSIYVAQSAVSRMESGVAPISTEHAARLDEVLDPTGRPISGLLASHGVEHVSTIDELAAALALYRTLEDETSPAAVLLDVRRCEALAGRFLDEAVPSRRSAAGGLASEIAQYRGWLEHVTGGAAAASCFDRAVALAAEFDAPDRMAHGMSFRAYTALLDGDPRRAETLTRAALRDTRTHPLIRLYDHFQLARVHAQLGESPAARAALASAERHAERTSSEIPPDSGYWYTPGQWGLRRGRVLWLLGDHDQAVREARDGFTAMPEPHREASWARKWTHALAEGDLSALV